jgi:hypothetical protein
MGVGSFDLELILKLHRNGILPGKFSIAEIGAQQLGDTVSWVMATCCRPMPRRSVFPTRTSVVLRHGAKPQGLSCYARTPRSRRTSGSGWAAPTWRLTSTRRLIPFGSI